MINAKMPHFLQPLNLPEKNNIIPASILLGSVGVLLWSLQGMGFVFEDAAILMRYAEHLATGHGIVWNIGEAPADGATDFLFLVVIAGLRYVGLSIEWATRIPIIFAHLITVAVILRISQKTGKGYWEASAAVIVLATGPVNAYIAAGFGAPFFAMWAALICYLLFGLKNRQPWLIGFCCLMLGLTRPEGVLLAVGMIFAFCLGKKKQEILELAIPVVVCLFGIGGVYFLWRWNYFGHPLPTPFLKKGGFVLHKEGLLASWENVIRMLAPILVLLPLFRIPGKRNLIQWWLLVVVGFTCMWVLMSDEMNYLGRFQYPALVISVCCMPMMLSFSSVKNWLKISVLISLVAYYLFFFQANIRLEDSRYEAALILQKYKTPTSILLTSEAGIMPLYSTWNSVDAWGLNDPEIAQNGLDTAALALKLPHVIMFHAYFSPTQYPQVSPSDTWGMMVWKMDHFSQDHGYTLAAAWGLTADDTHYYYVLPNYPKSKQITQDIRALDYRWFGSGEKARNWGFDK